MKSVVSPTLAVSETLVGRHLEVATWLRNRFRRGEILLNVGCGFGPLESFIVKQDLELKVISLEPSLDDLDVIRRRIDSSRIAFCAGSALSLPIQDASIDTYVASEVLEHIPRDTEESMFHEIARVLKPGGRALLTTPRTSVTGNITDPAWWLTGHRHYSESTLKCFIGQTDLQVICMETRGSFNEILSMWDLYISKWVLRRPPTLARLLNPRVSSEWSSSAQRQAFTHWWLEIEKPDPAATVSGQSS